MKIKISYPNDYESERDISLALKALGLPSDASADTVGEVLSEFLAHCARRSGLKFIHATDFGAVWSGTAAQVRACRRALPSWAYVSSMK